MELNRGESVKRRGLGSRGKEKAVEEGERRVRGGKSSSDGRKQGEERRGEKRGRRGNKERKGRRSMHSGSLVERRNVERSERNVETELMLKVDFSLSSGGR